MRCYAMLQVRGGDFSRAYFGDSDLTGAFFGDGVILDDGSTRMRCAQRVRGWRCELGEI